MTPIVAIVLGAHEWPESPVIWTPSGAFERSALAIRDYFLGTDGLSIEKENLLWLFDDPRSVGDIDYEINRFLSYCATKYLKFDVILYYVGHGAFTEGDNRYCLALRSTRISNLSVSAYRIGSLAHTLNQLAGQSRRYLIFDACFAGAAQKDFEAQSFAASRMESDTIDAMVEAGTALLCAASSADVALSPKDGQYTMFSGALIEALNEGSPDFGSTMSLDHLRTLTAAKIRNQYRNLGVRPEIHIPDQRKGNVSDVRIFPNRLAPRNRPNESLIGHQELASLENKYVVAREIVPVNYVESVADFFIEGHAWTSLVAGVNRDLREIDQSTATIRMGALSLQSTSLAFWNSAFDEAFLSGHRTLAALIGRIAGTKSIDNDLKRVSLNLILLIREDFARRSGKVT